MSQVRLLLGGSTVTACVCMCVCMLVNFLLHVLTDNIADVHPEYGVRPCPPFDYSSPSSSSANSSRSSLSRDLSPPQQPRPPPGDLTTPLCRTLTAGSCRERDLFALSQSAECLNHPTGVSGSDPTRQSSDIVDKHCSPSCSTSQPDIAAATTAQTRPQAPLTSHNCSPMKLKEFPALGKGARSGQCTNSSPLLSQHVSREAVYYIPGSTTDKLRREASAVQPSPKKPQTQTPLQSGPEDAPQASKQVSPKTSQAPGRASLAKISPTCEQSGTETTSHPHPDHGSPPSQKQEPTVATQQALPTKPSQTADSSASGDLPKNLCDNVPKDLHKNVDPPKDLYRNLANNKLPRVDLTRDELPDPVAQPEEVGKFLEPACLPADLEQDNCKQQPTEPTSLPSDLRKPKQGCGSRRNGAETKIRGTVGGQPKLRGLRRR